MPLCTLAIITSETLFLNVPVCRQAEYQIQERYFDPLVKKEQLEEKMKDTKEMKCRAVSCKKVPASPQPAPPQRLSTALCC